MMLSKQIHIYRYAHTGTGTHEPPTMHARRPPLGQRRQARAPDQIERGEGGEVAEPEGERASVAQREGERGGAGNRDDGDGDADDWCVCVQPCMYHRKYCICPMYHVIYIRAPPTRAPPVQTSHSTPPPRWGVYVHVVCTHDQCWWW